MDFVIDLDGSWFPSWVFCPIFQYLNKSIEIWNLFIFEKENILWKYYTKLLFFSIHVNQDVLKILKSWYDKKHKEYLERMYDGYGTNEAMNSYVAWLGILILLSFP